MSTRHRFSYKWYHWILPIVCIVLFITLTIGCVANFLPPTKSPEPASDPAPEVLAFKPEPTIEPEPITENETITEPEPITENETITETELILEPQPITENETITETEAIPEPKVYQYFAFDLERSYRMRLGKPVSSYISLSRFLKVGDTVSGFVEINDNPQIETLSTNFSTWYVEVLDPSNNKIYSWVGSGTGSDNQKFNFKASEPGEYITKIGHYSDSEKILFLKISPTGWTIEYLYGHRITDF